MANEVMIPTLAEALQAIGQAHLFYSPTPFTPNTWAFLGQKHGAIDVNFTPQWNQLRAEDITGPMVHDERLMGWDAVATVPTILSKNGAELTKISPTGTRGIGHSTPQKPIDVAVAIIPDIEMGGGLKYSAGWTRLQGNGVDAAAGAAAAPKLAVWFFRARLSFGAIRFGGGSDDLKLVTPVTIQAKFADSANVPEGGKLAIFGDPADATGLSAAVANFVFSKA